MFFASIFMLTVDILLFFLFEVLMILEIVHFISIDDVLRLFRRNNKFFDAKACITGVTLTLLCITVTGGYVEK